MHFNTNVLQSGYYFPRLNLLPGRAQDQLTGLIDAGVELKLDLPLLA